MKAAWWLYIVSMEGKERQENLDFCFEASSGPLVTRHVENTEMLLRSPFTGFGLSWVCCLAESNLCGLATEQC